MIRPPKLVRRLGGRIFLTFTVTLIFISVLFGFITTHFGSQLVARSSANELRVLSVVLSDLIQNQFSNLEGSIDEIAANEIFLENVVSGTTGHAWFETYLKGALERNIHLTDLMVYDMSGRCIGATDPDWYKIRGKTWKFFQQGLEGFNFPSIYGTESMGRVQLVSAPIFKDDDVVGVIVAIVGLKDIYRLMDQKIGLSDNTDAFLLDSDLRFITAGRTQEKGLVESHLASTRLASHLRDEFWVGEYDGAHGQKVLGTALKIPGYSWYVVVERDYRDVLSQITALNRAVMATIFGLLIIFILATLGVSRSITSPLLRLVQSTRKIAAGQYGVPVDVSHEIEEVAFIGAELEKMRRKIASSQEKLRERLSESEQLRIESERLAAIGSLAASLAHEIRNPLNAMSLLLSRLQYSANEDTRKGIVGDLFGEIGRLDRLVSSILDYARPVHIERRSIEARQLLLSVVDLYQSLATNKGCRLTVDAGDGIVFQGDPDRLKQCLVNLVKNSLDAMDQGGLISLSARDRGDAIEISVTDDGPGIPDEIIDKLFTPFFTTKESGTGLGLSAVQKIISAHGGKINVANRDTRGERGAQFLLSIPTI
jgi:signal transduction histidine kinase